MEEADVPRAVAEIARVVRSFALLKISNRAEGGAKVGLGSGVGVNRGRGK